jgi:Domain of Unknown Function (DUF1206)
VSSGKIRGAQRAIARAQPWPDRLARGGYVTRGALFLLVGGLAAAAAAGLGGEATDPSGALATLARAPAGRLVLVAVALGLLAYAAFRGALAFIGEPYEDRGPVWRGMRRIVNLTGAVVYLGLAITAGVRAWGVNPRRDPNQDAAAHHWSARLLSAPFGRPLLMGVAAAILIAAAVQLVRAFIPRSPHAVRRRLRVEEMSEGERRTMSTVGRTAFVARATVLAVIGYSLAEAAVLQAPRLARGPGGALHAVWELPHGALLLGLVGCGLMAFGTHCLLEARWRRLFHR